MNQVDFGALLDQAIEARDKAYAPYSHFAVGSAVLAGSGQIYRGCNVENVSSGLTVCAERAAVVKAVSEGERTLLAVAVAADVPGFISPCGACRQVLAEFGPGMQVVMGNLRRQFKVKSLVELFPEAFAASVLPLKG